MEAGQRLGLRLTLPQGCEPCTPLVVRWSSLWEWACRQSAAGSRQTCCPPPWPMPTCCFQRLRTIIFRCLPLWALKSAAHRLPSHLQVVLGWYGAQDRHVAKYASLLEKEGYPSVRGVLPGPAVFSPLPFLRRRFAAALLDFLVAVDPEGARKVVFYAFSNGEGPSKGHLTAGRSSLLRKQNAARVNQACLPASCTLCVRSRRAHTAAYFEHQTASLACLPLLPGPPTFRWRLCAGAGRPAASAGATVCPTG